MAPTLLQTERNGIYQSVVSQPVSVIEEIVIGWLESFQQQAQTRRVSGCKVEGRLFK